MSGFYGKSFLEMATRAIEDIDYVGPRIEVVEQINIATSQFFDDDTLSDARQRARSSSARSQPVNPSINCASSAESSAAASASLPGSTARTPCSSSPCSRSDRASHCYAKAGVGGSTDVASLCAWSE
jgi:hypothetical protein